MSQNNLRYNQKFSKLNWEKIAWRHLLKFQNYWNGKVLLDIIATTIKQLNSLFELHYWSSKCRRLMTLLMKWAQFFDNYQKSNDEAICLAVLFFMYYRSIPIYWQTKGVICFMNVLLDVYIFSYRKKSELLLPEGTVKCTHLAA